MPATIVAEPVTVTRWHVECDCGTDVGTAIAKTPAEAEQMLIHHCRQREHQAKYGAPT